MKHSSLAGFLLLFFGFFLHVDCTARQLDETGFQRLHDELNPQGEAWKTIPWQTSLIEAQNISAKQGKPLFIWAMDGHPLGCT